MSHSPSRVVLITGGSRGLGRNAALALAADGADILLTYRSRADAADAVVAQIQALGRRAAALPLDMADSAGFADTTPAQFDELVAVHLKGPYFLTQALLPLIADGGRILNVSSGLARFSLPGSSAYAMMKGGIEVFSRYLARELGARGISANTLAPGAIETDFGGGHVRDNADINAMVAGNTALGRAGQPDDIGPVVAALLSPRTAWINAQRVEASGGMFV